MRVLLAAPSSAARLHNLVPLAWALRTAGHDVKIAGRPSFVDEVLRTGCVAVDLEDGDGTPLADSAALVAFAELWRPDVVVSDGLAPAGATAARAVSARAVRLLGALDEPGATGSDPFDADTTFDAVPPSLRPAGADARPIRHVPYFGPVEVPGWLRRAARRDRVLLSLADPASSGAVFEAVTGLDVELLCAIDPRRVPAGVTVPVNVKLVDSAPPAALLRTCVALVHDGDAALALAAAAHGLPQLCLTGADLAARVADAGAGVVGPADRIGALLADDGLRARATAIRDEIAALPAPRAVVAGLTR
ncbi:nucleotide disphospho-sugar-binding domain-containing protein [Saccharothrix longispora]|uniref:UDP:flavonoid glycosyltransferase YjiC (YdhE family) n=1 Tax=Saccharothrix longispora TaxID=33920 RepID=A0ABU1PVD8_9PSEU|nr:nucleotide disphospho-sugar-binding domain-containing protein [Saccharothrix longispora]MDR6594603.1 UDP:flavonoid glycosyltransferase YjiC (YdhE family) [Saccharothrix longispora]